MGSMGELMPAPHFLPAEHPAVVSGATSRLGPWLLAFCHLSGQGERATET